MAVQLTVEPTNTTTTTTPPKLIRRNSAVGKALHYWERHGKSTIVQAVLELEGDGLSIQAITNLVDERLLKRFPKFRGYVSNSLRHWVISESVDPSRYVSDVNLEGSDHRAALLQLMSEEYKKPLPAQCMWEVKRVSCAGRVSLLFRFAHTLADGITMMQILQHVLPDASDSPSAITTRPPRSGLAASCCMCAWAFLCEMCFLLVFALSCCASDRKTSLRLGPSAWKRRKEEDGHVAVISQPVSVAALKAAGRKHNGTVNDVMMAALAAGVNAHLAAEEKGKKADWLQHLTLTAVMLASPRREGFVLSAEKATKLLDAYAAMKTPGCDLVPCIVPLPCGGALTPDERLAAVLRTTRSIKISGLIPFLQFVIKVVVMLLPMGFNTALFEALLFSKTTMYVSPVVGPEQKATIGGVGIDALYAGVAPLDFGTGWTFFTYNGKVNVICIADKGTVSDPQGLVDHVHKALVEYCAGQEAA